MSTIALVTGGNRGIGREVCRQLVARGHTVILTARSRDDAADAARPIGADPLQLAVTGAESVAAAGRGVEARYGHLDVLVNNAAILYDTWQLACPRPDSHVRPVEGEVPSGGQEGPRARRAPAGRRDRRGNPCPTASGPGRRRRPAARR